jgi:uncharacterized protein
MRTIGSARLTDAERGRIEEILLPFRDQGGMNLEMVDGFFAALLCCPDLVMLGEYLPELFGGDDDGAFFSDEQEANGFLGLLVRHWNAVAAQLHSKEIYTPLLTEDDQGIRRANDWAEGFLRGMRMRKESWKPLLKDEDHGGLLVPIFALANEHNPDPKMRPAQEPMSAERRDQLIAAVVGGVMMIYDYFEPDRRRVNRAARETDTYRRETVKIGRNDPCYCGSGKKYKKCCGNLSVQ